MLKSDLLAYLELSNPWLKDPGAPIFSVENYIQRIQMTELQKPHWDSYITILTGPRQAGKTTLGRYLCQKLIESKRYQKLLYLSCDELLVREWLTGSQVVKDMTLLTGKPKFILFIDEIQRLKNPGLLLKSIHDLKASIKIIATGSSQLELKSKVQEFLTGRQFESVILPLSIPELGGLWDLHLQTIYGSYPKIVTETEKTIALASLYKNYTNKDIIEILKIRNADIFQHLLMLLAHASGQLVNYQQLATDCRISSHTVQHYLSILENTYVVQGIKPFIGNKRTEITSNPIYYFIDNGFRNQALNNFLPLTNRTDAGLLIQSAVFQELHKFRIQNYLNLDIKYWRTKSGAEVDFVLYKNEMEVLPVEVKYQNLRDPTVGRGFRSFLEAYQPGMGIVITKDLYGEMKIGNSQIYFIPFTDLQKCFGVLKDWCSDSAKI